MVPRRARPRRVHVPHAELPAGRQDLHLRLLTRGVHRARPRGLPAQGTYVRTYRAAFTQQELDRPAAEGQPRAGAARVQAVQGQRQEQPRARRWLQADVLPDCHDRVCRCMVSSVLSTEYLRVTYMFCRDTVASVGLIRSKTLPFTTTNRTIKTFRHALSLDEVYFHAFCMQGSRSRGPCSVEPSSGQTSIIASRRTRATQSQISAASPTPKSRRLCRPSRMTVSMRRSREIIVSVTGM